MYNLINALKDTYKFLSEKLGQDAHLWKWGKVHKKYIKNMPFTYSPFKFIFDREYADNGNQRTLDISVFTGSNDSYDSSFTANSRIIMSMDK